MLTCSYRCYKMLTCAHILCYRGNNMLGVCVPPSQLHRQRSGRVHAAARLHPPAAGEQGALGGPAAAAAPAGAAAPRAGGVQAAAPRREAETHRAAEGAAQEAGGGEEEEEEMGRWFGGKLGEVKRRRRWGSGLVESWEK